MTPKPVRLALRRTLARTRHVRVVPPRAATGRVRDVYQQVERDFGILAPPVALHSPAPLALAGSWMILRETLVAEGAADRASKEAVAAAVSLANACPYCVEVHSATLGEVGTAADAEALSRGRCDDIVDPRIRAIAAWARGESAELRAVSARARAELIGVAVTFEYLNRMVRVFLDDSPIPPNVPVTARKHVRGMLGRFLRPAAGVEPGASLSFLPPSAPPRDLEWAAGNPTVVDALAQAGAAFDAVVLADSVREVVTRELADWDGQPPGISRTWLDPVLSRVSEADRPVARLALLTVKAPYQVDDGVIADFRGVSSGDAALIECTSWASMLAARRRGVLLGRGVSAPETHRSGTNT